MCWGEYGVSTTYKAWQVLGCVGISTDYDGILPTMVLPTVVLPSSLVAAGMAMSV